MGTRDIVTKWMSEIKLCPSLDQQWQCFWTKTMTISLCSWSPLKVTFMAFPLLQCLRVKDERLAIISGASSYSLAGFMVYLQPPLPSDTAFWIYVAYYRDVWLRLFWSHPESVKIAGRPVLLSVNLLINCVHLLLLCLYTFPCCKVKWTVNRSLNS